MKTPAPPRRKNIWEELEAWNDRLQRWQKFALCRAVAGGRLSNEDLDLAYRVMLVDNGLAEVPGPSVTIPSSITGRPRSVTASIRLVAIRDVRNVNALHSGAELKFSSGLTVVYGQNAAGKSGFFRLLSASCFSRSASKAVLPNVYTVQAGGTSEPSADIVVAGADDTERTFHFPLPSAASELRRFSVFDASIADIHIDGDNEFSFKPTGFDVFPELVRVHEYMIRRLEDAIRSKSRPNTFPQLLVGSTSTNVTEALNSLGPTTGIDSLRLLGTFGDLEAAQFAETDRKLGELRATSIEHLRKEVLQAREDISRLLTQLRTALSDFSPENCHRYQEMLKEHRRLVDLAATESKALESHSLNNVGSTQWERFVTAAHEFGEQQSAEYPDRDEPCLLCHRPLDDFSRQVIRAAWEFIRGRAREGAIASLNSLRTVAREIEDHSLDIFQPETRVRSYVERNSPQIASEITSCIEQLRAARATLLPALNNGTYVETEPVPVTALHALQQSLNNLSQELARLATQDKEQAIRDLAKQHTQLRHKQVLAQNLSQVIDYVTDLKWIERARAVRQGVLRTTAITDKETALAGELLGADYHDRLSYELRRLRCVDRVTPKMKGRSGRTVRTLAIPARHRPTEVLSEGEQRAVALADFLTEVSLNPQSAGIILDDPVTSLDNERKDLIAQRLVEESRTRQVIVFTHDMEFLVQLCDSCEKQGIVPATHWVATDGSGSPGLVTHDDGPLTSKTYKTSVYARAKLEEAKATTGNARVALLREGCDIVRTCLERLVIDIMLQDLISPYRRHVRMTKLPSIRWSIEVAKDTAQLFEEISAYIGAHCRPDGAAGSDPTPPDLEQFILRYDQLRSRAKGDSRSTAKLGLVRSINP